MTLDANEQVTFRRQLAWIAVERGYKPGWVAFKFKERFGIWPTEPRLLSEPMEPNKATLRWLAKNSGAA